MAKHQVKQGSGEQTGRKEDDPRSRAQQAEAEGPTEDPRVDLMNRARARAGQSAKGPPAKGGKGRDARALREQSGANAKRGNKPPAPEEEEEEDKELEEDKAEFWKDLVDGAYRSRKRRGEWDGY